MDEISQLSALTTYNRLSQLERSAGTAALNSPAGEEFLMVFYKEMLKQAIKPPAMTYDPDNQEEQTLFSALNTDIMVEQFAKQLVKNQLARPAWVPAGQPDSLEEGTR